jgi:hypothetical protein
MLHLQNQMKQILPALLLLLPFLSRGQSPLSSGFFNYHLTDRYEILSDSMTTDFFTGIKPYRRDYVAAFSSKLSVHKKADSFNQNYLLLDNIIFANNPDQFSQKSILRYFYPNQRALFYVNEDRFKLVMNPLLGFAGGKDKYDSSTTYRNSRGVELFGNIGNKVGFYSYALENQSRFPTFLNEQYAYNGTVTGATLAKGYKGGARDFYNVAGHVTASPIDEITVQFGHDKNFIGNGYRSLILSDQAAPNTFLKLNTKVWKINYMNLYSVHTDYRRFKGTEVSARKFSALHHLSINLGKNFTLGLFENVIFDRQDSLETGRFEVDYLNPLIFYRAVEHGLVSSDNVILGTDWKWNFLNHFSFYGQFILDEFIGKEFFSGSDSWVNKWAYQAGLKYINVANISNLDMQIEINQVRPYMYQHRMKSQNWIHYDQALAHPLGANFREVIAIVRYQPISKLSLNATYSYSKQGVDSSKTSGNYGGDFTRVYNDRNSDIAPMFQGVKNQVSALSVNASYMLWHNLFLDAGIFARTQINSIRPDKQSTIYRIGLRLNLAQQDYRN